MFYRIAVGLVRLYLYLIFRVQVSGSVPKQGGCLICANHTSYYDPVVIAAFCGRPLTFMAKEELFSHGLFGWLIRRLGAFPVKRDANGFQAVKTTLSILKQQKATVIFPEGKRNRDGNRSAPKAGAVMIAQRAGVPIIPVGIHSSFRPFSSLKVTYGTPITYDAFAGKKLEGEELDRLANQLMNQIFALTEEKA